MKSLLMNILKWIKNTRRLRCLDDKCTSVARKYSLSMGDQPRWVILNDFHHSFLWCFWHNSLGAHATTLARRRQRADAISHIRYATVIMCSIRRNFERSKIDSSLARFLAIHSQITVAINFNSFVHFFFFLSSKSFWSTYTHFAYRIPLIIIAF